VPAVFRVYIWWSDVTVICGHNSIFVFWDSTAYCVKLSDLWRYSNKIESVGLRNVLIVTILLRKCCHSNKHFAEVFLRRGRKTAGIDMVWRNYVTVALCYDHRLLWRHLLWLCIIWVTKNRIVLCTWTRGNMTSIKFIQWGTCKIFLLVLVLQCKIIVLTE